MGLLTTLKQNDVFRDEKSLAFDGSNDYVLTDFKPDYIHTNATIAFWVKMNDFSSDQYMGCHNNKRWYFGFSSAQMFFGVADNHNGSNLFTISPAPVAGQWLHYCVTAIDGTATGYINGIAQGNFSYTQSSSTNPDVGFTIAVQNRDSSLSGYMNCNISEIAQYNVGLTASQVKTIYNGREPYNHKEGVASGNLQAWYRMGDGSLDGFDSKENGLIQSHNSKLESSIVTSWTNASAGFNTLNTTGTNITSMINNDSGTDNVRSNSLTVATDDTYKVSFDVAGTTIPSSINKLMFKVSPNNALNSSTYDGSVTGAGSYIFYVQPQTTTIYVGFRAVENVDCNVTNFKMQKITNNSGLMKNMTATDIEGDTP